MKTARICLQLYAKKSLTKVSDSHSSILFNSIVFNYQLIERLQLVLAEEANEILGISDKRER